MEPNMKRILDEISQLNRRFDEQDSHLNRRFADLERSITDRSTAIDSRLQSLEAAHVTTESALSRRVADLEAAPADPQVNAVESRVATLEASYVDRDTEFNNRLRSLEALRVGAVKDESDDRLATLEKATKELCAWRPDVDGVLDDIRISVQKMAKTHARAMFDEMPPSASVANSPTKAAANSSEVFTAELPVFGRRVESTTWDTGPGVVTTWIPVPAKGTPSESPHVLWQNRLI
jgi:chromosome segregation ATPase